MIASSLLLIARLEPLFIVLAFAVCAISAIYKQRLHFRDANIETHNAWIRHWFRLFVWTLLLLVAMGIARRLWLAGIP